MGVNKKLGRFKQWAGERMGGEAKTTLSEDFKSLEEEMNLRNEGLNKNHASTSAYVKALSKKGDGEDKEKVTSVAWMGQTMVNHGEDFENDSEFGQCLISLGHTNERISRFQDTYSAKASTTWLEGLERSLAQMKEYQASRKKLEQRRLGYDTALAKMQKAKKEDFRAEEELRCQKAKYEESSEDVFRRMQDIQEAEADSVADLTGFLDAELAYYARCHEALQQLRNNWPAGTPNDLSRKNTRSRGASSTAHSFQALEKEDSPPPQPERPAIRSTRNVSSSFPSSPRKELPGLEWGARPGVNRSSTYDTSLDPSPRMARVPSETLSIRNQKAQLRGVSRTHTDTTFDSSYDVSSGFYGNGAAQYGGERSTSPAVSVASSTSSINSRKGPPPPPPSRAKKPPPPPPPMKRSALSASSQPTYA